MPKIVSDGHGMRCSMPPGNAMTPPVLLRAWRRTGGLYPRAGFVPQGQAFTEVGIEHIEMLKQL